MRADEFEPQSAVWMCPDHDEAEYGPIYAREELPPGWTGSGLAVIEQDNATILVPPGFAATVGEFGDLMLRKDS